MNLFEHAKSQPPRSKEIGGTSEEAARKISKSRIEATYIRILDLIKREGPSSADRIAERLGEDILFIRPRVSELGPRDQGKLIKTNLRETNKRGNSCICWALDR